jgi:hypothetical protein
MLVFVWIIFLLVIKGGTSNHSFNSASYAVGLFYGVSFNNKNTNLFAFSVISIFYRISVFIFESKLQKYISSVFLPINGNSPVNKMKRITPIE